MFIDAARAFALRIIYTLGEKEVSIRCVPSAFQKPTSIKKKKGTVYSISFTIFLLSDKKIYSYNLNGERCEKSQIIFFDFVRSSSL